MNCKSYTRYKIYSWQSNCNYFSHISQDWTYVTFWQHDK